jgi:hypothetical protein
MHELQILLGQLVAQLESAKPNPQVWNSSAARALEQQLESIQHRLRSLQAKLIRLPEISL